MIRFAEIDDLYAIQKLVNDDRIFGFLYLNALERWVRSRRVLVALGENDNEVVGTLVYGVNPAEKIMQIRVVSVRNDCRRRGIGSSLMAAAESLAVSYGMKAIELWCPVGSPANYFYLSLGYESTGYKQSRKGRVLCLWRKSLL